MATSSAYLIQDQNISIHYDGASLLGKNGISKAQKKGGGIGGRKALNDISNSAKPSALQSSKKNSSTNVISIGKDPDASKSKFGAGRKALANLTNSSKPSALEKKDGRKALADLTNSSKSAAQQVSKKKGLDADFPTSVADEQFVHDHQKCIKSQKKAMDMSCFLKEVGLDNDVPLHLAASPFALKLSTKSKSSTYQPESPTRLFAVEEMPELMIYDQVYKCGETDTGVHSSPYDASPKSAKPSYISSWKEDDSVLHFALIGTPNQLKY